ncbi:CopG family transcriptional regulator [Kribbella sp. NPDC056951]|uniref:CopG family transcriptional regulator n=1 Tax=Kribbella sp. NPDC056951 TaxID=3345978 RepID=UPI00363E4E09
MSKKKHEYGEDVDLDVEVVRDGRGKRITEERAAELAEEAVVRVRAGRPSLSGSRKSSPQIAFRVPDELQARAEAKAKARGMTVSQFAREALERAVGE